MPDNKKQTCLLKSPFTGECLWSISEKKNIFFSELVFGTMLLMGFVCFSFFLFSDNDLSKAWNIYRTGVHVEAQVTSVSITEVNKCYLRGRFSRFVNSALSRKTKNKYVYGLKLKDGSTIQSYSFRRYFESDNVVLLQSSSYKQYSIVLPSSVQDNIFKIRYFDVILGHIDNCVSRRSFWLVLIIGIVFLVYIRSVYVGYRKSKKS